MEQLVAQLMSSSLLQFIVVAVYMIPAIIAFARRTQNAIFILLLNILLGWTVVGWIIAVVLACSASCQPRLNGSRNSEIMERTAKQVTQSSDAIASIEITKHSDFYPYARRPLLSEHERFFFSHLDQVSSRMGYRAFVKVRLADLIQVKEHIYRKEMFFRMVSQKHVDFVLCAQNLYVVLVVELDDSSHETTERQKRDELVNAALDEAGIRVLHIKSADVMNAAKESNGLDEFIAGQLSFALTQNNSLNPSPAQ